MSSPRPPPPPASPPEPAALPRQLYEFHLTADEAVLLDGKVGPAAQAMVTLAREELDPLFEVTFSNGLHTEARVVAHDLHGNRLFLDQGAVLTCIRSGRGRPRRAT